MLTAEKVGRFIMSITIKIPSNNGQAITERLKTDEMGLFTASEWKRLINPYTPRDTGTMENTAVIEPFRIRYVEPYSHYQYVGISKSGVPLIYQTNNPFSTDHWDEKAANAGQLGKLEQIILNKLL